MRMRKMRGWWKDEDHAELELNGPPDSLHQICNASDTRRIALINEPQVIPSLKLDGNLNFPEFSIMNDRSYLSHGEGQRL